MSWIHSNSSNEGEDPIQHLDENDMRNSENGQSKPNMNLEQEDGDRRDEEPVRRRRKPRVNAFVAKTFFDLYCLNERKVLGRGCNGTVYECSNLLTNELYAVKVLNVERSTLENIRREVEVYYRVRNCEEALHFIDYFEEEEICYLVFEKMNGGSLSSQLERFIQLPEELARIIIHQVATAVKYLHDRGIAHRDIKPDNILCSSDNIIPVKLGDFDLSSTIQLDDDSLISSPTLMTPVGSAHFLPPEIARILDDRNCTTPYEKRCDIWSLGVVIYYLLCGYPPFVVSCNQPDCTWNEPNGSCHICIELLLDVIQSAEFNFHYDDWKLVSEEGKDLIRNMLQKDTVNRYTIDEVLNHPCYMVGPAPVLYNDEPILIEDNKLLTEEKDIDHLESDDDLLDRGYDMDEYENHAYLLPVNSLTISRTSSTIALSSADDPIDRINSQIIQVLNDDIDFDFKKNSQKNRRKREKRKLAKYRRRLLREQLGQLQLSMNVQSVSLHPSEEPNQLQTLTSPPGRNGKKKKKKKKKNRTNPNPDNNISVLEEANMVPEEKKKHMSSNSNKKSQNHLISERKKLTTNLNDDVQEDTKTRSTMSNEHLLNNLCALSQHVKFDIPLDGTTQSNQFHSLSTQPAIDYVCEKLKLLQIERGTDQYDSGDLPQLPKNNSIEHINWGDYINYSIIPKSFRNDITAVH
ncbi:hypothetical protein SNEBB_001548 [Seison nebaliae]|nr:hypothetical protein SNEBB_001548 [Seison nebaliae]